MVTSKESVADASKASDPGSTFKSLGRVRTPKTAEIVANSIRSRILNGDLKEGDCLPPEAQLIDAFSISRPTLREAFRILEAERLISVMQGSRTGARIHEPRVEGVARYAGYVLRNTQTKIADIYDARLAIEPYVVRTLAETKPKTTAARLRKEAERLKDLNERDEQTEVVVGLAEFHRLIVELGGNQTLSLLVELLQDIVKRHQLRHVAQRSVSDAEQRKRCDTGIRSFFKLIDLIEAGRADEAESHWRQHVEASNKVWISDPDMLIALENDDLDV